LREGSFTLDGRPKYKIDFFNEAPNGNGGYYVVKITLVFIPDNNTAEIRDAVRTWFNQIANNANSSRFVFQAFDYWLIDTRPIFEASLGEGVAGFLRFNRELQAMIDRNHHDYIQEELLRIQRLEQLLLL
jgi:hypothetical protein